MKPTFTKKGIEQNRKLFMQIWNETLLFIEDVKHANFLRLSN